MHLIVTLGQSLEKLLATLFFYLGSIKKYTNAQDSLAKNHGILKPATLETQPRMHHNITELDIEGRKSRAFIDDKLETTCAVRAGSYGKEDF